MATMNVLPNDVRNLLGVLTQTNGAAVLTEVGTSGNDLKTWLDSLNRYYQGLDGIDQIVGNTGSNYIEGGDVFVDLGGNSDTLGYFNSTSGVTVTLNVLGGISASGGHASSDFAAAGFENLVGSEFNDGLTGNDSVNKLVGMGGNDTLCRASAEMTSSGAGMAMTHCWVAMAMIACWVARELTFFVATPGLKTQLTTAFRAAPCLSTSLMESLITAVTLPEIECLLLSSLLVVISMTSLLEMTALIY